MLIWLKSIIASVGVIITNDSLVKLSEKATWPNHKAEYSRLNWFSSMLASMVPSINLIYDIHSWDIFGFRSTQLVCTSISFTVHKSTDDNKNEFDFGNISFLEMGNGNYFRKWHQQLKAELAESNPMQKQNLFNSMWISSSICMLKIRRKCFGTISRCGFGSI